MSAPNPLLDAALYYASLGWRVLPLHNFNRDGQCTCQTWRDTVGSGPCPTPAKHPRFKGFQEAASTDGATIRRWWNQYPRANVAIVTGAASKLWALDVDPRNGGDWAYGALVSKIGSLPYTTTTKTGGGGRHYYFRWPEGFDIPSMVELDDGLEVIGESHVLVAPPSTHKSGNAYQFEPELGPDELQPIDAPAALLDLIRVKLQPAAKPLEGSGAKLPPAEIGPILSGCAWMAHCSDTAASLGEPQWYAQLSILGRCSNGEELAHELSSPHPGYNRAETQAKLGRALSASGPVRCSRVRNSLGGERFCSECPSWGKIKSPIVLGIQREQPPLPEEPPAKQRRSTGRKKAADPEQAPPEEMPVSVAERAVMAAIGKDDVEAVYRLAPLLAGESETVEAALKSRLEAHFKKRIRIVDLNRAIKAERSKSRIRVEREELDWTSKLLRGSNWQPKAVLANAIAAFRHAPEWKGVICRNEFAECAFARTKPPIDAPIGKWTTRHDIAANEWLQQHHIDVNLPVVGLAVESISYDRLFHPVREYLTALKWDGRPRLRTWLAYYLGATVGRDVSAGRHGYLHEVGTKWMVSAVARVMRPGCKADYALVIEGEQGKGKSTALDVLGGEWFTDQIEKLGSKDSSMQVQGVWIIEISELGSMNRAEKEEVKAFMSRKFERFRPPYAGRLVNVPRQCVFGGTVNPDQYFKDETGARRFWPVSCSVIKLAELERDRDQLWAEAKHLFDLGETWWLDKEDVIEIAREEQADRYVEDPWQDPIGRYIKHRDDVSINDLFADCLKVELGRRTQADRNRIGNVLRFLGWKRERGGSGSRSYLYRPHTEAARLAAAKQQELTESEVWPEGRE